MEVWVELLHGFLQPPTLDLQAPLHGHLGRLEHFCDMPIQGQKDCLCKCPQHLYMDGISDGVA